MFKQEILDIVSDKRFWIYASCAVAIMLYLLDVTWATFRAFDGWLGKLQLLGWLITTLCAWLVLFLILYWLFNFVGFIILVVLAWELNDEEYDRPYY